MPSIFKNCHLIIYMHTLACFICITLYPNLHEINKHCTKKCGIDKLFS